jgi:hypothetical protein
MLISAALAVTALAPPAYEPAPTLRASSALPARLVRGKHHEVAEEVRADGFYERFRIESDFGVLEADGRTMLHTRLAEVDALARLDQVSKAGVFASAAGNAVLTIGRRVGSVVKDPVGTAKGIPGGLKRFGVNLGRQAKRAAGSVTSGSEKGEPDERTDGEKALDAAGGAANSVLGINGAARRWARKLGVDPYTTNPLLHDALVDVGRIDAAGGIAARIALPIPALATTTASVGGLVWDADPEELRKLNERRLAELGVTKDEASRFLRNRNYTLTSQTRLVAALQGVQGRGCGAYVESASEAEDEREALFFVESAEMLASAHGEARVAAVLEDSRAMVARTGGRALALLPLDRVRWTEDLERDAREMAARARTELGVTRLEVRVSGKVTPAARSGLRALGWTVREGVSSGLALPPAK